MILLSKLITEGRYDSLVTRLSRELLDVIKQSYAAVDDPQGKFAGVKIHYSESEDRPEIYDIQRQSEIYFTEVENESIPVEFYLELRVQWVDGLNDLLKGGDAYNDTDAEISDDSTPPLIELRFEIDPAEYPQVLSKIAMEMRDTLRHEIEHVTQSGWNVKSGKYIPSDKKLRDRIESGKEPAFNYFILPKEVDANLHGLHLYAKKTKQPLRQVVATYLNKFVSLDIITPEQRDTVLAVWRKRLPALAIRQEI
jgi:hypothetical protein